PGSLGFASSTLPAHDSTASVVIGKRPRTGRPGGCHLDLVDIFPNRNMIVDVPRAATTSDTFNAIAEPRRRDILDYLAPRERPVGDIVLALGLAQPSVSKHLRVLRDVGLVEVRRDGLQVVYRT